MADAYLQHLQDEGKFDSHGSLTLDPARARTKLAEHRFHLGVQGLLAVVSANLLAGATRVRIEQVGRTWHILSDAPPPERSQLAGLLSGMFSSQQPLAWRELGLAVNSLYPRHCQDLSLMAENCTGSFEGGDWRLREPTGAVPSPFRLQLTLRQPSPWTQWWRWLPGRKPGNDLDVLKARTRWSPIPVEFAYQKQWVSSYHLDPPMAERDALALLSILSDRPELGLPPLGQMPEQLHWQRPLPAHSSFRCQLLPGNPQHSTLLLVYRGVTLADVQLVSPGLRFWGVVHSENLELDAARQNIVPGERLSQLLNDVKQWLEEGLCAWLWSLEGKAPSQLLDALRLLFFDQHTSRRVQMALAAFPVVQRADGSYLTLDELRASLTEFELVHVCHPRRDCPATLHGRPLVSERQKLGAIKSALRTKMTHVDPFVRHALDPKQPKTPTGEIWAALNLTGPDWQARLSLPQDALAGDFLSMKHDGVPFWASDLPLFGKLPTCLRIELDGRYAGAFQRAVDRIQSELCQAIPLACGPLLSQVVAGQHPRHNWHFYSLLALQFSPEGRATELLDPRWLDAYLKFRQDQSRPTESHPAHLLARWLDPPWGKRFDIEEVTAQATASTRPIMDELLRIFKDARATPTAWPRQGILNYGSCYLILFPKYVLLGFIAGAQLDDPDQLLRGSQGSLRYINLRTAEYLRHPALRKLIEAALA